MNVFSRGAARGLPQAGRNVQLARAALAHNRRNFGAPAAKRSLEERLAAGETVLCAEGYLLALARRGYIAHGVWVPEFMLEQPEVLRSLSYEFVHCGTDVVEAFQVRQFSGDCIVSLKTLACVVIITRIRTVL